MPGEELWGFSRLALRNIILAFLTLFIGTIGYLELRWEKYLSSVNVEKKELYNQLILCEQAKSEEIRRLKEEVYVKMRAQDSLHRTEISKLQGINVQQLRGIEQIKSRIK